MNSTLRYTLIITSTLLTEVVFAQEIVADKGSPLMDWALHNIVFLVGGVVILSVLFKLWDVMNLVFNNYQNAVLKDQGLAPHKENSFKFPSLKKLYAKAWDLLPMDRESELDLGHDYDGIKELDNKLPPWWLYLFYATILWAGIYVYLGHFSDFGISQTQEYENEMEVAAAIKLEYLSKLANAVDETNVTNVIEESELSQGQDLYNSQCVACHGVYGQGGIGPNFTDNYWIHGGDIKDLFKTIKYGVPEKGMISWKSQLSPSEMQKVASFILTLEGTNPENQKAPEGSLYKRDTELSDTSDQEES